MTPVRFTLIGALTCGLVLLVLLLARGLPLPPLPLEAVAEARQSAPDLQPTFTYDLSTLGLGILFQPEHVETDGNPATEEWMLRKVFTQDRIVIAVTPSGLCFGQWFYVPEGYHLTKRLGRSVYTALAWPQWDVRAIPHPAGC